MLNQTDQHQTSSQFDFVHQTVKINPKSIIS